MKAQTLVKLKKVGNSQAIIIPSNFLKGVDKNHEIEMNIVNNEIRLIFTEPLKSLKELIDEKRARNKKMLTSIYKKIEQLDSQKFDNDYIINGADELID